MVNQSLGNDVNLVPVVCDAVDAEILFPEICDGSADESLPEIYGVADVEILVPGIYDGDVESLDVEICDGIAVEISVVSRCKSLNGVWM